MCSTNYEGNSKFFWNVGTYLQDYTASHSRRSSLYHGENIRSHAQILFEAIMTYPVAPQREVLFAHQQLQIWRRCKTLRFLNNILIIILRGASRDWNSYTTTTLYRNMQFSIMLLQNHDRNMPIKCSLSILRDIDNDTDALAMFPFIWEATLSVLSLCMVVWRTYFIQFHFLLCYFRKWITESSNNVTLLFSLLSSFIHSTQQHNGSIEMSWNSLCWRRWKRPQLATKPDLQCQTTKCGVVYSGTFCILNNTIVGIFIRSVRRSLVCRRSYATAKPTCKLIASWNAFWALIS